jgi:predicted transcriptional regulator
MFSGLMLNRIYWFRKLTGIRERLKHLLVIEEFHVLSSAEKSKGESRIEFLVKMCREFSQGVMILEQNPGRISDAVLGNLNSIISMKLGHSKDIAAVGMAMAMDAEHKRYLSRLPTGWAISKSGDRMSEPVLVKVDAEKLDKSDISAEEIRVHNRGFVMEIKEVLEEEKTISSKEFAQPYGVIKFAPIYGKILRFLKINDGANLKTVYIAHGLSYRRGNTVRKKLEGAELIFSEEVETETGKETRLFLTEEGEKYLKRFEQSKRLGGEWHRTTAEAVASYYKELGYLVRFEYRDIDVFAEKGKEKIAIEVESLSSTKDYIKAVTNALKALRRADRLEIVVKDRASGKKLKEALSRSPLKSSRSIIRIRLLEEYGE